MTVFVDEWELRNIIRNHKLIIASDGSYHPEHNLGTAAVIIESDNGISIAKGYCKTHGTCTDVNAYRSELMGIFMGILFCSEINKTSKIEDLDVEYICDNETSIDKCYHHADYHSAKSEHVDVIWAIQK